MFKNLKLVSVVVHQWLGVETDFSEGPSLVPSMHNGGNTLAYSSNSRISHELWASEGTWMRMAHKNPYGLTQM